MIVLIFIIIYISTHQNSQPNKMMTEFVFPLSLTFLYVIHRLIRLDGRQLGLLTGLHYFFVRSCIFQIINCP